MLLQVWIQMKMYLKHMKVVGILYWIGSENKHQFQNNLYFTFYILYKINLYFLNIILLFYLTFAYIILLL